MKKNGTLLLDAFFLFLFQLISSMVIYFAVWMINRILDGLVIMPYFATMMVYAIGMFLGLGALICFYGYMSAYRAAAFSGISYALTALLASILHLLISAVFGYMPLFAGAALPAAGLIALGDAYTSGAAGIQIPGFLPAILFGVIMLFYHALGMLLSRIGCRNRLRDRLELTGQNEN